MGRVDNIVEKGKNIVEKREKCLSSAFFSFPTMCSEGYFLGAVKSGLCGKGLNGKILMLWLVQIESIKQTTN